MDESRHLINQQLWEAVEEGNQRAVERLIKDKGDPNYKSTYGFIEREDTSLLMVAADRNCQSIVQLLLKHGARINDSNEGGLTTLHYASINGYYEIVQQLIKSGANVDAVSRVSVIILISNYHGLFVYIRDLNEAYVCNTNKSMYVFQLYIYNEYILKMSFHLNFK
jgi:ankyrin repeat protein